MKWPRLKRRQATTPESQKAPESPKEQTEEPILEYKETIVAEERPARPTQPRQPAVKRSGWESAAMVEEKVDVIVAKGTTSGPGTTLERKVDRTLEKKKARR